MWKSRFYLAVQGIFLEFCREFLGKSLLGEKE